MAKPLLPAVFYDDARGMFKCEMRDKKTAKVWGHGWGESRRAAIAAARADSPKAHNVKRMLGWVYKNPFWAGVAVGCFLAFRRSRNHPEEFRIWDTAILASVCGLAAFAIGALFKKHLEKHLTKFLPDDIG